MPSLASYQEHVHSYVASCTDKNTHVSISQNILYENEAMVFWIAIWPSWKFSLGGWFKLH